MSGVLSDRARAEAQRILDREARRILGEEIANGTRPGMVPQGEWAKTDVAKASRYGCSKCGEEFDSPDAVYDHLDAEHPEPRKAGKK